MVLDDVTSGLDSKTANALSAQLFQKDGYFRRANISVIIASNDGEFPVSDIRNNMVQLTLNDRENPFVHGYYIGP